jgi:maleylpyruvate isomerase
MKLYSYWRSSASWRARLVLGLKGIAYEYVAVNIAPTVLEQQSKTYDQLNPMHQVPTLVLDHAGKSQALTQSVAIAELLEELYPTPPLLPSDPMLRARVRQAVQIINSGIQPLQNIPLLQKLEQLGSSDEANTWARTKIHHGLHAFQRVVAPHAGRYSFGDAITLADVFLVPQLYNARRFGADLSDLSLLVAIEGHCAALPAFAHAHPDVQPDAPRK